MDLLRLLAGIPYHVPFILHAERSNSSWAKLWHLGRWRIRVRMHRHRLKHESTDLVVPHQLVLAILDHRQHPLLRDVLRDHFGLHHD